MCLLAAGCTGLSTASVTPFAATPPAVAPRPPATAPPVPTLTVAPPTPTATVAIPRPTATAAIARATATASPRMEIVDIRDNRFSPSELTIPIGTRVLWINGGETVHDVVANDGSFRSNSLVTASRFSHTFDRPGRYTYYCTPHISELMVGVIVVE